MTQSGAGVYGRCGISAADDQDSAGELTHARDEPNSGTTDWRVHCSLVRKNGEEPMMKVLKMSLATLLAVGCGGAQSSRSEAPPEPAAGAYTTSTPAPAQQHTMPDGTTMEGHEHMEHGGGQHVMPDGGAMQGQQQGASHVMPDGTVMPGAKP